MLLRAQNSRVIDTGNVIRSDLLIGHSNQNYTSCGKSSCINMAASSPSLLWRIEMTASLKESGSEICFGMIILTRTTTR